jgi:hypothetical protein
MEQGDRDAIHAARLVRCNPMVACQLVGQFVARAGSSGADDRPCHHPLRALPVLAAALPRRAPPEGTTNHGQDAASAFKRLFASANPIAASEMQQDLREDEIIIVPAAGLPLRIGRAIYFRRPEMIA